jgi:hypothetical protein
MISPDKLQALLREQLFAIAVERNKATPVCTVNLLEKPPEKDWHVNKAIQHMQNNDDDASGSDDDDRSTRSDNSTSSQNCRSGTNNPDRGRSKTRDSDGWFKGCQTQTNTNRDMEARASSEKCNHQLVPFFKARLNHFVGLFPTFLVGNCEISKAKLEESEVNSQVLDHSDEKAAN